MLYLMSENAISMFSAYSNTFADLRCSGSRDFDRRGFKTLGYLEQLLREPRRIETLNKSNIARFQSKVAY